MRRLSKQARGLRKIRDGIYNKYGEGFFTVFGICAFLFVMCGLFIGLLGRGWGYAWGLVLLGALFSVFPIINHVVESRAQARVDRRQEAKKKRRKEERNAQSSYQRVEREAYGRRRYSESEVDITSSFRASTGYKGPTSSEDIEATKKALRKEADIAKQRLRFEKENSTRKTAEQERYEADRAAYLQRKRAAEQQKEAERLRKLEEEQRRREENAKKQKEFNENYFKRDNIKKPAVSSGYFQGVSSGDELKKRYKELLKKYHPDNADGDADITFKISSEYKELSRFYKAVDRH